MIPYAILRPVLHRLSPEKAHALALYAVRRGLVLSGRAVDDARLVVGLWGLTFSNPVGLAAGFDKNAEAIEPLLAQGFGFVEVGTVTPRAQSGSPLPRLFRLPKDEAVINRLGFNNLGVEYFVQQLSQCKSARGVVGANIGRNRDSEDANADYVLLLGLVSPYCDYVTINVSSPNTQGLRAMQQRRALESLLVALMHKRAEIVQGGGKAVPLLLKIAPDLEAHELEDIAVVALEQKVDGLIISNTTIRRPSNLQSTARSEQGGLSGKPLFELSTQVLREMYRLTGGQIPLVGVGGISSGADAYTKIRAGASLVQFYTALIYQGFGLVRQINHELLMLLERDGFSHIREAVGADAL